MDHHSFYDVFDNRSIRIAVMGVLGILALFLLAQTIDTARNLGRTGVPATDTITVSGEGQAALAPDVARITFTVQNTAKTVSAAQEETTKQSNAALAYLKEQKIADKDVKTLSYNIYPQYSYPTTSVCMPEVPCPPYYPGEPKITGYQVSESIQVTVRDLSAAGALIGGLGKLEVQNLYGPAFALDDSTAGYDAARADAIAKAKAQATRLANQLGVRLGKIVSFSESSGRYYSPAYDMGYGKGGSMMAEPAPAPTMPAGENTYNASVSITYEIR